MRGGRSSTALTVALTMGLAAAPVTAEAGTALPLLVKKKRKKKDGLTAEQAADRRMPIQGQGQQMVAAGELTAATILYDGAARQNGDPVLFLDSGDVYLQIAKDERDIPSAEAAKARAQTAQDILYFHLDAASDPDYRLVTNEEVSGLLARAGQLIDDADATIAEIQDELDIAAAPAEEPKRKGDGKGMRLAGIGFIALGAAGVAVGATGLILGGVNQSRVDDPAVYGSEFDQYDSQGRLGNTLAIVGLVVGGASLAAGTALFIIGKRRGRAKGSSDDAAPEDSEDPSLAIVPTGRGLALTGRF